MITVDDEKKVQTCFRGVGNLGSKVIYFASFPNSPTRFQFSEGLVDTTKKLSLILAISHPEELLVKEQIFLSRVIKVI